MKSSTPMKFLFISDTHVGSINSVGFRQQARAIEQLPNITSLLKEEIDNDPQIKFIVHGGDIIEETTHENIKTAVECFDFPVPLYLTLGNHDLTDPNSLALWQEYGTVFFEKKNVTFSKHFDTFSLHIIPNQWGEETYYWKDCNLNASFLQEQLECLDKNIAKYPNNIHIIVTHSPVYGLSKEQTGLDEIFHDSNEEFKVIFDQILKKYPQVKLVLSGHNHANMNYKHNGVHFMTVASLTETPFEYKLIEVTPTQINVSTKSLASRLDIENHYDYDKTHIQGRRIDREAEIACG